MIDGPPLSAQFSSKASPTRAAFPGSCKWLRTGYLEALISPRCKIWRFLVPRCQACSREIPANSRNCPACGATVHVLDDGVTGHFEPKAQLFSSQPSDSPGLLE